MALREPHALCQLVFVTMTAGRAVRLALCSLVQPTHMTSMTQKSDLSPTTRWMTAVDFLSIPANLAAIAWSGTMAMASCPYVCL